MAIDLVDVMKRSDLQMLFLCFNSDERSLLLRKTMKERLYFRERVLKIIFSLERFLKEAYRIVFRSENEISNLQFIHSLSSEGSINQCVSRETSRNSRRNGVIISSRSHRNNLLSNLSHFYI